MIFCWKLKLKTDHLGLHGRTATFSPLRKSCEKQCSTRGVPPWLFCLWACRVGGRDMKAVFVAVARPPLFPSARCGPTACAAERLEGAARACTLRCLRASGETFEEAACIARHCFQVTLHSAPVVVHGYARVRANICIYVSE